MFDIELRKGDRTVGRQIVHSEILAVALEAVHRIAANLDADHMTITDARGELIGVFQTEERMSA